MEEIYRFPAVLDTEGFFQETENSGQQTDANTGDDVEDSDWFETEGPIDSEHFWELPNESWETDSDREIPTDESDDENWRRPPPINTTGLEWFYE